MAAGIVYLDVDDEITSAAARIRGVESRRVALVLPYGSRVATSRINFRLLSRDALINEKQLAVVAGDSSTRALAASAGLPVFGSVGEYETSLAGIGEERPTETTTATPPSDAAPPSKPARRRAKASSAAGAAGGASAASAAGATRTAGAAGASAGPASRPAPPDAGDEPRPAAPSAPRADRDDGVSEATIPFDRSPSRSAEGEEGWAGARPRPSARADHLAATRPGSRRGSRLPLVIVLAALALVVLVGGVGAYVILPSATIVVTPRLEDITLPAETVAADPGATEPDAAARVIPAELVLNDVIVSDTFPASGKRVEETAAKGVVRFSNLDFLRTNTVEAGSIVSTNAGVRFRTAATVTVPRADLVGLTVFPGSVNVNVTAVEPGTAANVEPNTIVVVPRGEDPQALKVVNPDAITGGTHEEFPEVVQEDVDAALETLTARIAADTSTIATAQAASPDRTVFEETLTVGEPTPNVDPATFVGQEIESFELQMTAPATILAVDPEPVTAIAETLIRGLVRPGYDLVADSIDVTVGSPVVAGQSVTFPVTARAQQVAILDADELRQLVLGKPLDTARALLAPYGEVELTAWPDWVSAVPTLADRVDVQIDRAVDVETPSPAGSTTPPAGATL
ncbi:MAG: baseplate J/gp47 family protein [Chloroflexota bacterium]